MPTTFDIYVFIRQVCGLFGSNLDMIMVFESYTFPFYSGFGSPILPEEYLSFNNNYMILEL
jgi:hypothetical protein